MHDQELGHAIKAHRIYVQGSILYVHREVYVFIVRISQWFCFFKEKTGRVFQHILFFCFIS